MCNFIIYFCIFIGEGNSKKTSKKRAAEAMLEKLRGLPPLPQGAVKPKKPPQKKKNRNLIKVYELKIYGEGGGRGWVD